MMRLLKRLEDLEKAIRFREPRIVVVSMATSIEADGVHPRVEAALAECKRQLALSDDDTIKNFYMTAEEIEQLPEDQLVTSH
jgi:hypothetical protein